jgi:hypothetical protein
MSLKELAEITTAILTSLGGGGAIVFGLSSYLGKVWADRGLEKQRHEYSRLNIAFESQLNIATRRLQVELYALGLVHKLRTQEEFTRLAGLWKHIANLRNCFGGLAPQGMTLAFQDPQEQKRWNAQVRQQFDQCLNDANMFLAEEALFIPKHICDVAEKATRTATEEQYNFAMFEPHLRVSTIPGSPAEVTPVDMGREYDKAKADCFKRFSDATEELEELMRQHIAGDKGTP